MVTASGRPSSRTDALPTSFRVDFSRGDDCLSLLTYGMAEGHVGEPTFVLSVQSGEGPARRLTSPQAAPSAADERGRVEEPPAEH